MSDSASPRDGPDKSLTGLQLEWFDHFLAGETANAAHQPGVDIIVMGSTNGDTNRTGRWDAPFRRVLLAPR
jgi:hypothetical protein